MSDNPVLRDLEAIAEEGWAEIRREPYWVHVTTHGMDKDLYVRTMAELYHYTRHNSINQALAAWRVPPEDMALLRFCYHHADEELGHEKMIIHDLDRMGVLSSEAVARQPTPATQALIGYLYGVGLQYGAVARLGYSYWAETCYGHLAELLERVRADLGLTDRQMTFFVAHQEVDTKHAEEVKRVISRFVRTDEERGQVKAVARTTLYLTGQILDNVVRAYRSIPT